MKENFAGVSPIEILKYYEELASSSLSLKSGEFAKLVLKYKAEEEKKSAIAAFATHEEEVLVCYKELLDRSFALKHDHYNEAKEALASQCAVQAIADAHPSIILENSVSSMPEGPESNQEHNNHRRGLLSNNLNKLYKAAVAFKYLDVSVDVFKAYDIPTVKNFEIFAVSYIH